MCIFSLTSKNLQNSHLRLMPGQARSSISSLLSPGASLLYMSRRSRIPSSKGTAPDDATADADTRCNNTTHVTSSGNSTPGRRRWQMMFFKEEPRRQDLYYSANQKSGDNLSFLLPSITTPCPIKLNNSYAGSNNLI